jgi:hypothetical protein
VPQWTTEEVVVPEHTRQVIVGYEDDLTKPIPVMEAVMEELTRTRMIMDENDEPTGVTEEYVVGKDKIITDEDGVEISREFIPRMVCTGYRETGEYDGYYSKPIYADEVVPEQRYESTIPVRETVPADPGMDDLYRAVYDYTELLTDSEGNNYTRPKLMGSIAGVDVGHIL